MTQYMHGLRQTAVLLYASTCSPLKNVLYASSVKSSEHGTDLVTSATCFADAQVQVP